MKSGLLWYDADPKKPIWDKIEEAAQRYYEKFGVRPDTCFVNPSALPPGGTAPEKSETPATGAAQHTGRASRTSQVRTAANAGALHVTAKATVLPNHIWLGVSSGDN